jgi:hypothetical protein
MGTRSERRGEGLELFEDVSISVVIRIRGI